MRFIWKDYESSMNGFSESTRNALKQEYIDKHTSIIDQRAKDKRNY